MQKKRRVKKENAKGGKIKRKRVQCERGTKRETEIKKYIYI